MDQEIERLKPFIKDCRSIMIAPAGHGKTYCIGQCVRICKDLGCVLILTHTHAGIASIKAKLANFKIDSRYYHLETISGFIQHYVTSFCDSKDLPEITNEHYFNVLTQKGEDVFGSKLVKSILKNSYSCLFVDEYQDCTLQQNTVIMKISESLPTHLFGDEMQGIFNFKGQKSVSFSKDLVKFNQYQLLCTPWRWKIDNNNEQLGYEILRMRKQLECDTSQITLHSSSTGNVQVVEVNEEFQDYYSVIGKYIRKITSNSILVIVPCGNDFGTIYSRVKLRDRLGLRYEFHIVEALDDSDFYSCAKEADNLIKEIKTARKKVNKISKFLEKLNFNKTDIKNWIKDDKIIEKRNNNKVLSNELQKAIDNFIKAPSTYNLLSIIDFVINTLKFNYKREELLFSVRKSIAESVIHCSSVYSEMVLYKNRVRRNGRTIKGKCIGTTLLTKGLEFDYVVIIGANKFEDCKNFYVAISRASKGLYIFTKNKTLNFIR